MELSSKTGEQKDDLKKFIDLEESAMIAYAPHFHEFYVDFYTSSRIFCRLSA
jgi:hypothetical protein